jgi:glycosyltransferase involved in cell wall biosynthesis
MPEPPSALPVRVLLLTGEYPPRPGGVGDYADRLASALRTLGHYVEVLTSTVPGLPPSSPPDADRRIADWGLAVWRQIETAADAIRADFLHIQYQPGAFQLKGAVNLLPLWLRLRRPNLRTVTTFHDLRVPYLFPRAGPLRSLAVHTLLRASHGAIFVDSADIAGVPPSPTRRWIPIGSNVPNAPPADFDRATARRALGAQPDTLLIGYFGFLSAGKGADTLLRALRRLLDSGRPARLALIGATAGASNPTDRADESAALGLARALDLEPHIAATGYLDPPAVSAHLLACDALALPYRDGASFRRGTLLAAMQHARPIVTTPPTPPARGIPPLTLEPDRHFLAAPPDDPAALAAALTHLADDPALAGRLGEAARELADRCSWVYIAAETSKLYRDCLSRQRQPRSVGPPAPR